MTISFQKQFTLTVPLGAAVSASFPSNVFEDMVAMLIQAPAVLVETVTFETNALRDGTGAWSVLQDDTPADVAGPTAGKSRFYNQLLHAPAFRIKLNGNAAADRAFILSGQWTA